MNFLTSAHIHSLLYIHDGHPVKILDAWGNKPLTIVTPEKSKEFQQELWQADLESLKEKYDKHLIVLTDAAWVDYEPVFIRTIWAAGAKPKLLVLLACIHDADLLPLVNLVRANDGFPILFDHAHIDVALRGNVMWDRDGEQKRTYACPSFNPFEPYPVYMKQNTADFTNLLHALRSPWDTMASFFNFKGSMLFACNTETKKIEVVRFFRCNGFIPSENGAMKRNDTCVYVSNGHEWSPRLVQQLHVVDPPYNMARTMAQAKSKALTVYLYVRFSTPFEESPDLKAYRTTLGRFMCQAALLNQKKTLTTFEVISGLFVHNPLWTRAALVAMAHIIAPEVDRKALLDEMTLIVQEKMVIVDAFEREGYLVFSENMYIYQPFMV